MNKITLGLIGYGNVGSGVVKFLQNRKEYFRDKFKTEFVIKTICDRSIHNKKVVGLEKTKLTTNPADVINDRSIEAVIELVGGMHPAREIIVSALKNNKHVITANKELLANCAKDLFRITQRYKHNIYFESAVGAGIPVIKTITEGVAGNKFHSLYGIINGTCNFILTEMTKTACTFKQALEEAQRRGFAESNPTLDINGMDSAHKLAILVYLGLGKFIALDDMHVEGIAHISHVDIEHAESLNLTIKLLGIAKKDPNNEIEARVHPTLIPKDHPLASVNGVYNAIFLDTYPLGHVLLSGEGAGQMSAASGVVSDLLHMASRVNADSGHLYGNLVYENPNLKIKKIDQIRTKFYLRFMATDKPGVLSKITGILGKHGIGIDSVTQKAQHTSIVPIIMLTDYVPEKMVRLALDKIHKLPIVKSKPVAIRMEKLR